MPRRFPRESTFVAYLAYMMRRVVSFIAFSAVDVRRHTLTLPDATFRSFGGVAKVYCNTFRRNALQHSAVSLSSNWRFMRAAPQAMWKIQGSQKNLCKTSNSGTVMRISSGSDLDLSPSLENRFSQKTVGWHLLYNNVQLQALRHCWSRTTWHRPRQRI